MDPSFCDLEFFDFKDSSDEEIKEIQAILKGPKSEGCVKLPWKTFMKTKCPGNLPPNEGTKAESSEDVEETPQVHTTTLSALPPPVVPLPPAAETYVSLPTTVGPSYHNTPYFVSRTLPYLRTYPPMGMPLFAFPLPGEASPFGFVPMTHAETTEAGFKRQSSQRGSSKNKRLGSESPESANPYPEGCPTSVPLVPLSVPPPTFVGGNLPMHGYPPGLHTSPAMYYVPVFNHPYGGYIQAPGPPMMLPVNIAATTDLKCPPPVSVEETLPTDNPNESPPRDINGVGFELPNDNKGSCELTQEDSIGHVDSPQNDLGLTSLTVDLEEKAEQAEIDCGSGGVLMADNCDPAQAISAHAVEDSNPVCYSDNKSNSLPNDTAAKMNVPEHKDITNNKSKSPPSDPPNKDCLPETGNDCLEEIVVRSEAIPKDSSSPAVQKTPTATAPLPTKEAAKRVSLSEVAKPVDPYRPSKCWADLFKRPSAVNGFESPPEPNGRRNCDPPEPRKVATGEGRPARVKRGVSNGKVPSSNSLH